MSHNNVGNIEPVCVLDERPTRLAPTRVSTQRDVRFEVLDVARMTILGLLCHSLKEEIERVNETALHSGSARQLNTSPKTIVSNNV